MRRFTGTLLVALMSLCGWMGVAQAEELPWKRQFFDLQATNEPLNVFLIRLFTLQGLPAVTSAAVATARVNGRFKGSAPTVFREVVDTFGLTWYYDGGVVYVYSLGELESRLLTVEPADVDRVDRALSQMHLSDPRFPVRLSRDEGQVYVAGPPRYVEIVSGVVDRVVDTPSRPAKDIDTKVFKLRYARAADTTVSIGGVQTLVPGIATLVNDLIAGGSPPQRTTQALSHKAQSLLGKGMATIGTEPANNPAPTAGGNLALPGNPDSAASDRSANAAAGGQSNAPASTVAKRDASSRHARADLRLNAVVVSETFDRMPIISALIASLDVEQPLIEIEASVIDVDTTKSSQLGIDWRAHGSKFDISSSPNGYSSNGTDGVVNAANGLLASNPLLSAGTGLVGTILFGSQRDYFLSRINALAENGDAKMVSRPRVLTLDNLEAVLQNTRDFYVRVSGYSQTDLYNVTLGLTLRVTPSVIQDAHGPQVKLQISIEDGSLDSTTQVDQIPVVNRNAIATQAVVGDQQSLLIGGYVIDQRTSSRDGLPWLSDVPIIGWLFGQQSKSVHRVERMFMITPRLVRLGPGGTVDQPARAAYKALEDALVNDPQQDVETTLQISVEP